MSNETARNIPAELRHQATFYVDQTRDILNDCANRIETLQAALQAAEQCIGELSPTQARVEAIQMIQAALAAAK